MIPNADEVVSAAEARLFHSDIAIWEAVAQGYFVRSGCAVAAGSGLSVSWTAGVAYVAGRSVTVPAGTNFSTGIAADGTNPKFVLLEVDATGAVAAHAGTAQANPEPPTPTASTTVIAALYIPANATAVEVWAASGNTGSKCQIIDKRQGVGAVPAARIVDTRIGTARTNPTALTSLYSAAPNMFNANEPQVGDVWKFTGVVNYANTQNASTAQIELLMGASVVFNRTTSSLATTGVAFAVILIEATIICVATGASGNTFDVVVRMTVWSAATTIVDDQYGDTFTTTVDTTAASTFDLQCKVTTSSSTMTFTPRGLTLTKLPV